MNSRSNIGRVVLSLAGIVLGLNQLSAADEVSTSRRSLWHVEADLSFWLNTKLTYGALAPVEPSQAAKSDRFYDDGFNRVDASGNLGDGTGGLLASRTGYFGFSSDSQVDLKAGTLAMHQLSAAPGDYVGGRRPEARPGLAVSVRRSFAKESAKRDWGFEVGIDFQRFKKSSSGADQAALQLLTDTYQLGGVVPQRAPYTGRFSPLPGDQRIGDTPTRTRSLLAGTATGTRSFECRTVLIHLGPWIEISPETTEPPQREADRWSLLARGGPALQLSDASFAINETLAGPGLAATSRASDSGSAKRRNLGWLVGVRARRTFNDRWAAIGSADYLSGAKFTTAGTSRYVRFDTSSTFRLELGLEYGFSHRRKE